MSYADTKVAFEQFFNTHWTYTPIFWPNSPFDPPRDSAGNAQAYVSILMRENETEEITLGSENPWYRAMGSLIFQLFIPERTGERLADSYADICKGIFRRVVAVNEKSDITIIALDQSFNSSTVDFITRGFVAGLEFTTFGATNAENNGIFTVLSVTQTKLKVVETTLVDESPGASLSFHAVKYFNYRNSGLIRPRLARIIQVGLVFGWYQTNVIIPYSRDFQL